MADFPFINAASELDGANLPLFKMYDFDFDKFEFKRDGNGKMILLEGNGALRIWITKALMTERFRWLAYSTRYGVELKKFIGEVMQVKERKSELKRMIVEALMVNPYVKSVDSVTFDETQHSRLMTVNIAVTTIYGSLTL